MLLLESKYFWIDTLFDVLFEMFDISFLSTLNEALFPIMFLMGCFIMFLVFAISGLRLLIVTIIKRFRT